MAREAGRACVATSGVVPFKSMAVDLKPIACCAPLTAPSLSDEEAGATAVLFRALGDPARVRIVNLLADGPASRSASAS